MVKIEDIMDGLHMRDDSFNNGTSIYSNQIAHYNGYPFRINFIVREDGEVMNVRVTYENVNTNPETGIIFSEKLTSTIELHPSPTKYVIKVIDRKGINEIVYEALNGKFIKYYDFDGNYWDHEMGMDFAFPKPKENVIDAITSIMVNKFIK